MLLFGLVGLTFANVTGAASDPPKGFLAEPKSGQGTGVLVLHPWWGLNADVEGICKRLAASGYVAFAPDLFEGKTASNPDAAEALVTEFNPKESEVKAKILDGSKYLERITGKKEIAVVGLSFGAYYALDFSNAHPSRVRSVVVFYGTGAEDYSKSKASYLGHFADKDDFEPKSSVDGLAKLLKRAGRPATIYTYAGTGHWFFEPGVKTAYNKAASDLAWSRTVKFLKQSLPFKKG